MGTMTDIIERFVARIHDIVSLEQFSFEIRVIHINTCIYHGYDNIFVALRNIPPAICLNGRQIPLIIREQYIVRDRYIRLFSGRFIG
ncbi:hypothetical protein D3C75_1283410 [compost metagenome]